MRKVYYLLSLSLIMGYITLLRPVVDFAFPQFIGSFNIITRYLSLLSWGCLVLVYLFLMRDNTINYRSSHNKLFQVLQIITFILGLYGLLNGNGFKYVISQYIGISSVILILSLSKCNELFERILKLLTMIFYINVILMLITKDTLSFTRLGDETYSFEYDERFTGTISFTLRSILNLGYFLCAYAIVSKGVRFSRIIQIASIFFVFYFEVFVFQFRSILFELALFFIVVLFIKSKSRIKITLAISFSFVMVVSFIGHEKLNEIGVISRFKQAGGASTLIMEERTKEIDILINQFTFKDFIIGRGIAGSYNAERIYGKNGENWRTTHFGIMLFLLDGGIFYLLLILYLLIVGLRSWLIMAKVLHSRDSSIVLASWITFPIVFLSFIFNPLGWSQGTVVGISLSLFAFGQTLGKFDYMPEETMIS